MYVYFSFTNGASSYSSRDVLWVRPKLRVRIIDKKYRKGKYFNTKVSKSQLSFCLEKSVQSFKEHRQEDHLRYCRERTKCL